jgi:tRNA (cmo5U34)-methyltransferase
MMTATSPTDFDANPPMPPAEYEHVVTSVNMGYELMFTVTCSFLRSLGKADLNVLVVGAGGGAEIERFLPDNPGWRVTGVDPSREMLNLAAANAERLGVADRVSLIHGSVDDLPADHRFDAATCLFVLHFLPDDAKIALLRGMSQHIHRGALSLIVSGCRAGELNDGDMRDDLLGAWQQYGELHGMAPERMKAIIADLLSRQNEATTEEGYRQMMHEAGFTRVTNVVSIMGNAMCTWIAR